MRFFRISVIFTYPLLFPFLLLFFLSQEKRVLKFSRSFFFRRSGGFSCFRQNKLLDADRVEHVFK